MHPKGVLFDLNGTLLVYGNMEKAWADWLTAVEGHLEELGVPISRPDLEGRCQGFFSRREPDGSDDCLTVYERRLQTLLHDLGARGEARELRVMADQSAAAWQQHVQPDPEAHALLAELRREVSLALVTNFDHPPHIDRVLADFDMTDYFDTVTVSGAVGVKKPDPQILTLTLRVLDLEPQETVFVGDAPEDIQAAVEAGVTPIHIFRNPQSDVGSADYAAPRRQSKPQLPDCARVSSLGELGALLASA